MSSFIEKERIKEEVYKYFLRTKRSQDTFKTAVKVSGKDLKSGFLSFIDKPSPKEALVLSKDIIGSGAWITNTYIKYVKSFIGQSKKKYGDINDQDRQFIVEKVHRNIPIDRKKFDHQQIFNAIYTELDYAHHNPHYKTILSIPKIFPTVVLISGMLNEIYKTAAFERGVDHLSKTNRLKYYVTNTHGFKSTAHNVELIEEQLFDYVNGHPDEKLWIFAYSKGGIDALHFMAKNKEWAEKNIAGISTVASPILGTQHAEHLLINLVNKIHNLDETSLYKFFDEKFDVLAKELHRSMHIETRKNWFRENYHQLPENPFYSALALEADWYESHIYMILAKIFFRSSSANDGLVDAENAVFPNYFKALNLGTIKGHHLIAARSSTYSQEALISAHIVFLKYLNKV
jgi:hypothetical protein